jgi:hypothetical protein
MPRYRARAEFRRGRLGSPWVLAGVRLQHRFWPARPGVEPVDRRLRNTGPLGWTDLPSPIVAPDVEAAATVALATARAAWPARDRPDVPSD